MRIDAPMTDWKADIALPNGLADLGRRRFGLSRLRRAAASNGNASKHAYESEHRCILSRVHGRAECSRQDRMRHALMPEQSRTTAPVSPVAMHGNQMHAV